MSRRAVLLGLTIVAIGVGGAAYLAGVAAGRAQVLAAVVPTPQATLQPAQLPPFLPAPVPGQPPTMQELVPLPIPGDQTPGQRPQPQQGECEPIILFYHNGQLYQLQPGPGPQNGPGRPTAPPEFYQLNPYQGPPIPGLPIPQDRGPGFTPVNPRS
jgi:hypothetical protein